MASETVTTDYAEVASVLARDAFQKFQNGDHTDGRVNFSHNGVRLIVPIQLFDQGRISECLLCESILSQINRMVKNTGHPPELIKLIDEYADAADAVIK